MFPIKKFMKNIFVDELNRVFVSLRQACCRDSGHLGTPCRLKIMELIELRAMGWRSNLQHSQYYINREQFERQDVKIFYFLPQLIFFWRICRSP